MGSVDVCGEGRKGEGGGREREEEGREGDRRESEGRGMVLG